MVKQYFFISLFFILTIVTSNASAANIRVFVDRENIVANESFNLVFEADGSVDADPDFSPLNVYFDILNRSQSSNMSIVNGNYSRKTVWTLVLLAKQAGAYALPVIEFGNDKSPQLNIKILKASSKQSSTDQNLFLEASIDQSSVYVQAQLLYTLKLFRAVDIQNASLTEPELSDADAIIEKLGEDKRYQTTRNGVRFVVIERNYAIFPQQSGQLSINPIEFNGQVVAKRRSFFDSGFFNNTTKRIYSEKININVKPVVDAFKNKNWLPSSELKLVDEWPDNTEFKVGEPVTRTVSLIAKGLTAAQLPELAIKNISGIKQYPDQPSLNDNRESDGIIGIRQEKIAYIPTQSGTLTLPEINIPWWNTKTEQLEYARIDSRKITISASSNAQPLTNIIEPVVNNAVPIKNVTAATSTQSNFWLYSSIVLLIGWLSTLALWFKAKRSIPVTSETVPKLKPSTKNIDKKLTSACHLNNAELCKSLLIEWASQQWPSSRFNNLTDVADKVENDFKAQIILLNQSLYAHDSSNWDANKLLNGFISYKGSPLKSPSKSDIPLKPLTKLV